MKEKTGPVRELPEVLEEWSEGSLHKARESCIKAYKEYYHLHGRHTLPWRTRISPYRILVSEIMLQQTQVDRVLTKYSEWMKKFPNQKSLSKASLSDVLSVWKGLGYSRRAKALYMIARTYTTIPKDRNELLSLPGIGSYTASAIMAFAHNIFFPLVETNIRTVTHHHFATSFTKELSDKEMSAIVLDLFRFSNMSAKDFYYALMDYGSYLKKTHGYGTLQRRRQTPYVGSRRKLRAEILEVIRMKQPLPQDIRTEEILADLHKEGFIQKGRSANGYIIS